MLLIITCLTCLCLAGFIMVGIKTDEKFREALLGSPSGKAQVFGVLTVHGTAVVMLVTVLVGLAALTAIRHRQAPVAGENALITALLRQISDAEGADATDEPIYKALVRIKEDGEPDWFDIEARGLDADWEAVKDTDYVQVSVRRLPE